MQTNNPGFYTFELPEEQSVLLREGMKYSVVVTMKADTEFGIESAYKTQFVDFESGNEKYQSFLYDATASKWYDLYDFDCCARIKGYTSNTITPDSPLDRLFVNGRTMRIAGSGRYETALGVVDAIKVSIDEAQFDNIIVACGSDYPDALTGSYLAKVKNAPIILVDETLKREADIKNYISENLKSEGTVYILGGTGAVTQRFENSLKGHNVKRLSGRNRYDTNIAILKEAGVTNEDLLICTGEGFADSLSASAVGKPILLAAGNGVSSMQNDYLKTLSKGNIYMIGGTGAVSNKIGEQLKPYDKDSKVERVSGTNRYKTSVAVAEKFFSSKCEAAVLAYADNFPDGLSGGPLAMSMGAPLLLVDNTGYSDAEAYAKSAGIKKAIVLGGNALISDDVVSVIIE